MKPKVASASYTACEYDGADCFMADSSTTEQPCWGRVMGGLLSPLGDGPEPHSCQGHLADRYTPEPP